MSRFNSLAVAIVSIAAAFGAFPPSHATATTMSTTSWDQGWYTNSGHHSPSSANIFVGYSPFSSVFANNWFIFDLSIFAGQTVTSATLTTYAGNGTYDSPDASETWGLFDFTGSMEALVNGTAGTSAYTDLGGGSSYGTIEVSGTSGDPMPELSIALSLAAIADINATIAAPDKRFVIGGALLSLLAGESGEALFYGSGGLLYSTAAKLTAEVAPPVPLPAALPLFASGLAAVALLGWRRRRLMALATAA